MDYDAPPVTVREAFDLLLSGEPLNEQAMTRIRDARARLDDPDDGQRFLGERRREGIHPRHAKRSAVFTFGSMIRREDYDTEEAYLDARQWEVSFTLALLRDLLGRTFLVAARELADGINFGEAEDPKSNRGRVDEAFRTIYSMLYGV